MYRADMLTGAGFPAAEGWYATIAAPHVLEDTKARAVRRSASQASSTMRRTTTRSPPTTRRWSSSTRSSASPPAGKAVTRDAVRDAIQTAKVQTLQGEVSFDENGDLADRTVSVFQIKEDKTSRSTTSLHQYKYLGVAPQIVTVRRDRQRGHSGPQSARARAPWPGSRYDWPTWESWRDARCSSAGRVTGRAVSNAVAERVARMTTFDLLLQQLINGLSLGAMYALLALGLHPGLRHPGADQLRAFQRVHGRLVRRHVARCRRSGCPGQDVVLTGLPLAGVLLVGLRRHDAGVRRARRRDRAAVACGRCATSKGPAAMITTIGVSYILFNLILLTVGAEVEELPQPAAGVRWQIGGAVLDLREVLIWIVALVLMLGAASVRAAHPPRQGDAGDGAGRRSGADDGRRGRSRSSSWRSSSARRWPGAAG